MARSTGKGADVLCMSANRISVDPSNELLGLLNPEIPPTPEGDIPVLEAYSWEEFFDLF